MVYFCPLSAGTSTPPWLCTRRSGWTEHRNWINDILSIFTHNKNELVFSPLFRMVWQWWLDGFQSENVGNGYWEALLNWDKHLDIGAKPRNERLIMGLSLNALNCFRNSFDHWFQRLFLLFPLSLCQQNRGTETKRNKQQKKTSVRDKQKSVLMSFTERSSFLID